jgi:hypothetical protein
MEHRWGRRIAVDIPIDVSTLGDSQARAQLANVSFTGALIKADCILRIRSRIQIALKSPTGHESEVLRIAAIVTHKHAEGIGVEWCDMGSTTVTQLLRVATTPSFAAVVRFSISGGLAPRKHPYNAGLGSTSYAGLMESVNDRVSAGNANAAMHTCARSFASRRRSNDE